MAHHQSEITTGTNITLEHLADLKEAVRRDPNFQRLVGEAESSYVKGGVGARCSSCEATWELFGNNGFIEIKAAHGQDYESTVVTHLSCSSPEFGADRRKEAFRGDVPTAHTVGEIASVIGGWLIVITKPKVDPFADTALPKAP